MSASDNATCHLSLPFKRIRHNRHIHSIDSISVPPVIKAQFACNLFWHEFMSHSTEHGTINYVYIHIIMMMIIIKYKYWCFSCLSISIISHWIVLSIGADIFSGGDHNRNGGRKKCDSQLVWFFFSLTFHRIYSECTIFNTDVLFICTFMPRSMENDSSYRFFYFAFSSSSFVHQAVNTYRKIYIYNDSDIMCIYEDTKWIMFDLCDILLRTQEHNI